MVTRIRQIRQAAQLTQTEAAALAGRCPNAWAKYEISPDAVTPAVREDCDRAVRKMLEIIERESAA